MIQTHRAAFLLGLAAFSITLYYLHATHKAPSWRTMPQVVGLGDLMQDDNDTLPSGVSLAETDPTGISTEPSYPFVPGQAKPPGSNYTRNLIVAKLKEEDAGWLEDQDIGPINKMIYIVDDKHAPLHVKKNKGHEVMVYLSYIIDHYDELPDVSIFMHSHQFSWHQNDLLGNDAAEMVRRLSSERVQREGYMNLRCHWMPGCPDWMHPGTIEEDINKQEETVMAQSWAELFPDKPIPEILAQPCCAQFALSAQRIQVNTKEKYMFYREWLLRTGLDDKISGRVWEYLWQVVFTGQATFCPNQHACYCDGYGVCFANEKDFDYWFELRWKRHMLAGELNEWRAKAEKVEEYRKQGMLVGIEGSELEIPQVGRDLELLHDMGEYDEVLEEGRQKALERGLDPQFRAHSAGRPWSPGDGY